MDLDRRPERGGLTARRLGALRSRGATGAALRSVRSLVLTGHPYLPIDSRRSIDG